MYLDKQACANSVDQDETPRGRGVSSGSTLFASQPAIADTMESGSKLYLFKFYNKYGKELRHLNTGTMCKYSLSLKIMGSERTV